MIKHDQNKPRWDLLPLSVVKQIVEVLTFGAKKYAPDQWKHVPHSKSRYFAACLRHLEAWQSGERLDEESGKPHLAHAACCLIFLMWIDLDD